MIVDLVSSSSPILRTVAEKYEFGDEELSPIELSTRLAETMLANNGLGIAAPQIGISKRVFAVMAEKIIVMFNPIIVDRSIEEIELEEGCLSYPGLFVKVKRPKRIKIRYTEPNGNVETKVFEGMTARVCLHELDHLDGIIHYTRTNKIHLEKARREQKKFLRTHNK